MEFEKSAVPRKGQDDNLLPPLCVGRNVGTKTELSRRRERPIYPTKTFRPRAAFTEFNVELGLRRLEE